MAELTKRQMAAGQKRSLKAISKKLHAMAAQWGDVDFYCESMLGDLAKQVEEMANVIVEEVTE